MTLDEIIQTRRSIRKYELRPVEQEKLEAVLKAGQAAPSARNAQTWHFTAVRNAVLRNLLVNACNGQKMIGEAPCALIIWSTGHRIMSCGQSADTVDCSIALSFMILKAAELGLGTCWMGAFDAGAVKRVLDLPENAEVVAVSPMGYPAESPAARGRKPLDEICDIRV